MGEVRQKLLKEYLDISNVLKSLEPDEVHLQVLNVVLNYFPCEGQKQDKHHHCLQKGRLGQPRLVPP